MAEDVKKVVLPGNARSKERVTFCGAAMNTALEGIRGELTRSVGELDTRLKAIFDIALRQKMKDLEDITEALKKNPDSFDHLVDLANDSMVKLINNQRALHNSHNVLNQMLKEGKSKTALRKHVQQYFDTIIDGVNRRSIKMMSHMNSVVDNLYRQKDLSSEVARRIKSQLTNHFSGGTGLVSQIRREVGQDVNLNREVYYALKAGHHKQSETLNAVAKIFRDTDKYIIEEISKLGVPFKSLDGHIFKYATNRNRIMDDEAGFKQLLRDGLDFAKMFKRQLSDAEKDAFIEERFLFDTRHIEPGRTKNLAVDANRQLVFKGEQPWEFEYYQRYADTNNDMINSAFGHRADLLKNAYINNRFGENTEQITRLVKDMMIEYSDTHKIFKDHSDVEKIVEKYAQMAGVGQIRTDLTISPTREVADVISNLASAMLTAGSVVRNFGWDNTWHPAIQRALFEYGLSNKGVVDKAVFGPKAAMYAIKNIGTWAGDFATAGGRYKKLIPFFEDVGLPMEISMNALIQGERNLARIGQQGAFAFGTGRVADWVQSANGANRALKFDRMRRTIEVGTMLKRALAYDWDNLDGFVKQMARNVGMDETDWNQLKKAKMLKYRDMAGFTRDVMPDVNDLKGVARKLETQSQADARLRDQYEGIIHAWVDHMSAMVKARGNPDFLDLDNAGAVNRLLTKFYRINLSQYRSIIDNINATFGYGADGGDISTLVTLAWKNPYMAAQLYTVMGAGAMFLTWTKDAAQLREPSDFSNPHNMVKGMVDTGFGGLFPILAVSGYYNKGDPLNTPVSGAIRIGGNLAEGLLDDTARGKPKAQRAAKDLADITPLVNTWWLTGLRDKAADEYGSPSSRYRRKRARELGREKLFSDQD